MADNTVLNSGTGGDTIASDDIGGVKYQRVKPSIGADGAATDAVPVSNGMDVTGAAVQAVGIVGQFDDVGVGTVTENQFAPVRISTRRALLVEGVASGTAVPVSFTGSTDVATQTTLNSVKTSVELIDDIVYTDDTSTHATGTSKGALIMAAAAPTDAAVNANDIGAVAMTVNRELLVQVNTALPAGTNAIGKLSSNTGVTIGAVEVAAAQTLATVTTVSTLTGGGVAHDGVDSGNPIKIGGYAITALPTAVADADRANFITDKFGRQIAVLGTIRDLVGTQTTTISASTSETTIVTAGAAGIFNDLVMLIISNTSAATNTRIDFRDDTAGTILFSLQSNGGQPPVGFALPVPIPQTATAKNWTAQCATSTTDVRIYAVYQKNK